MRDATPTPDFRPPDFRLPGRIAAALVACIALGGVAARFIAIREGWGQDRAMLDILWGMARYFTILTNLLVGIVMGAAALGLMRPRAGLLAALTLWIGAVGIVYHALLAHLWSPTGLALGADIALHGVAPAAMALFWLGFAPKRGPGLAAPLVWLGWPLLYGVYALARGALGDRYPYPFLDASRLTAVELGVNIGALALGMLAGGYILVGLGRAMARIRPGQP